MLTLRTTLAVLTLTLMPGCTPSPEKVCAKQAELAAKAGEAEPSDKDAEACRTALGTIKKESPEAYACLAKCTTKAEGMQDLAKCGKACPKPSSASGGKSTDGPSISDTLSAYEKRADALTLDTVEGNLRAAYAPNFTVVERKQVAGQGILRVVIGNKNNPSDRMLAATLVLVEGSSKAEISKLLEDLKRGSRQASSIATTGTKKGLLARCDMERRPNDVPKPCGGYSPELDTLAGKAAGAAL